MKIHSVLDSEFKKYGMVLENYDFEELIETLNRVSPKPANGFIYLASDNNLESLPIAKELQNRGFGGMPIQIGYCNGTNHILNCLEYHRDSEISVAADDIILLLGQRADIENGIYQTEKVQAFLVPAGVGIELYATTLHYAPCDGPGQAGYRVVNILPLGTNGPVPEGLTGQGEDRLCMGTNKWLIAHQDAPEVKNGAFVGLTGENISIIFLGKNACK